MTEAMAAVLPYTSNEKDSTIHRRDLLPLPEGEDLISRPDFPDPLERVQRRERRASLTLPTLSKPDFPDPFLKEGRV